jgi:2-polyprenyl-3-methyl-5-hydroxy-6-metoxy-1,4-benzoquinol methylase
MTNDLMQALINVKKSIKPNGYMILTTPNAVRYENIYKIMASKNFYDPYSAHGSYGRHNREYTVEELEELLTELGFTIEKVFTRDCHAYYGDQDVKANLNINYMAKHRGQYIFILAKNTTQKEQYIRPDWLYSSYTDKVIKNA